MAKIAIIGAGSVGATAAYALIASGLGEEIVLIDVNRAKAEGEALDLGDSTAFTTPVKIYAGDYSDVGNADLIIFAAGANQRPGETRLDLTQRNVAVLKEVAGKLAVHWRGGILLMVTNPVDVLTYVASRLLDLDPRRVLGTGTILDSARFRYALSQYTGVDARNLHAYVIGEHGDTAVLLWSRATVAGIPLEDFCQQRGLKPPDKEQIDQYVRQAAYRIIERKGATYYAIGLGIRRLCEAILKNQHSVLTVTGPVEGTYGYEGVAFSLPTVVGREGRLFTLELPLSSREEEELRRSVDTLLKAQAEVGF
ncbi:L-lactate dehydrogenase [Ammonifex thiophilus]|uniref:L-lactate dehydrogenase n=1 Tax=Ammonifex thiophilus TaxID=444093 RepID=A0A3D8P504_9THEO|nr:L-lactate dehydrogenase [Ammonifex thiophilus]RDV82886.1 L-lactate dehydrogenase [Ammonifex thiophilus]